MIDVEMKEILEKCKLSDEELAEFNKSIEKIDHKQDHARAYRTMSNPLRRKILEFINCEVRSFQQIKEELELEEDQLTYQLSMLEQLNFIMNTETGWKATPRGIGFQFNTRL